MSRHIPSLRLARATILAAILAASTAGAHEFRAGSLVVDHPVIHAGFPGARSAGGYMTIENTGDAPDRLLEVRADVPRATLHVSRMAEGVMQMTHLEAVEIPAGESVAFAPGGLHVMFMGLAPGQLDLGVTLDATLVFERAGEVPVTFTVEPRSDAAGHADHDMSVTN